MRKKSFIYKLNRIRKIISTNRLYSWILVFIILIQAYTFLVQAHKSLPIEDSALVREELKVEFEKRKEAFQNLIEEDFQLALNLGYITLFMLAIFITGCVFLINYLVRKKRDNIETLPQTLRMPVPLWGLGDVAKVIILFIFFNYFFSISAYILSNIFSLPELDKRTNIVIATTFMDILVLIFVLKFVTFKYRQKIEVLGISTKAFLRNIAVALYAYIGFLPILAVIFVGVVVAAKALNYTPSPEPIYELIFKEERPLILLVISVLVSTIGPIIEEIFFRGFFYGALRKSLGIAWAIFLSAFFFSLLHTNVLGFIPIVALGMFLAYLREKTGSLIPSITVHIFHNSMLATMMFLMRGLTAKLL